MDTLFVWVAIASVAFVFGAGGALCESVGKKLDGLLRDRGL